MKPGVVLGGLLLLAIASPTRAETAPADAFDASRVPEALQPWIPWVTPESADCPLRTDANRHCTFAGVLTLDVDASSARFNQRFEIHGRGAWVMLPGDATLRPQDVRADGQPLAVVADAVPSAWLPRGRHEIDGRLLFATRPATIPVPADTAVIALAIDGEPVPLPARDDSGRVWLEARAAEPTPEDALEVGVFRRVADEVPLELETRLVLRAAGRPREVVLGPVLPPGFVPLAIEGSVPARLEADGRLRAQLRPGESVVTVLARHEGPATALALPATADGPWAAEEIWVFDARPALRIAVVEGVAAIDPNQTELPGEWRELPAYVLRAGDAMQLAERRRGDPDPHDDLSLDRSYWLDFDGAGLTFRDAIAGRLRKTSRLEMPAPATLGRVVVGGRDWFLTELEAGGAPGVEAPPGALALEAEGRIEDADTSALPAVGWSADMDRVGGRLNLPPGWALLHAFGVDRASPTWVTSWTLLDLFLVLVTAAAAFQLFGAAVGALALATLVLSWVEPGAPRLVWLAALAAEALVRVLRGRRIVATASRALRLVAWIVLALHVIPYAVDELQRGLHLAYAQPYESSSVGALARTGGGAREVVASEMETNQLRALGYVTDGKPAASPPESEALAAEEAIAVPAPLQAERKLRRSIDVGRLEKGAGPRDLRSLDPDARIPTGPGIPSWSWIRVDLSWSGPVRADQSMHLLLVSPFFSRLFSFSRVILFALFAAVLVRRAVREVGAGRSPPPAAAAALAALLLAMLVATPGAARAEFPTSELLRELAQRIEQPPACQPSCASVARLGVEVRDDTLRLRIEAHASVAAAIPLPQGDPTLEGFGVESVIVDARASDALHRANDGTLWVALAPGVHDVLVEARIVAGAERVDIALPLRPGAISISAPGWSVEGLDAEGGAGEAVSLRRISNAEHAESPASLRAAPPPFFARVERRLDLAVAWRVSTRVTRLSALGQAAVIEVPLLSGEALATEGIPVQDGKARVAFAPDASEVSWVSTLAPRESIELRAPDLVSWVEAWQLAVEPIWHVDAEGIPPIAVAEDDPAPLRAWRPWPGESLILRVRRPAGVGGATLTIDAATIELTPGLRSRDASLTLHVRSTQGGLHTLTLPEGAELRSVRVDGIEQPIRAEGRTLTLPIRPGAQELRAEWRSDEPMSRHLAIPEVALGAAAVNLRALVAMPEDRWILALRGPRMGPAVLFWSVVGVLVLLAWGLSRVASVPLRFHHWLLLGLGLTQVPIWMGAVVAGWFFALAGRRERGATLAPLAFDAMQIALAGATLVAIGVLFAAIQQGLLGAPEMQIAGNGSSARALIWYQDRSAGGVPEASVFSVPLFVYRAAMLAWALWLAMAFLRWLRWGFESYSIGGLWKSRGPSRQPPKPANL